MFLSRSASRRITLLVLSLALTGLSLPATPAAAAQATVIHTVHARPHRLHRDLLQW